MRERGPHHLCVGLYNQEEQGPGSDRPPASFHCFQVRVHERTGREWGRNGAGLFAHKQLLDIPPYKVFSLYISPEND